ncbi:MAG: hypothetical protein HFG17_02585 [Oscillospiraceae bacterium]|nr:hypothetical protein [Oscillospiraceae bacterium]
MDSVFGCGAGFCSDASTSELLEISLEAVVIITGPNESLLWQPVKMETATAVPKSKDKI